MCVLCHDMYVYAILCVCIYAIICIIYYVIINVYRKNDNDDNVDYTMNKEVQMIISLLLII